MMPPIIQQEFSALKLLEKMQRDGAPKEGGRGQEARAAIELIVQAATDSVSAVAYPLRESVILITTKIAQRFLLDKELIFMVRRAYDPTSKLIGNGLVAQLLKGGRDLAQLICAEAPPLLALGLTADNIGKLAYKLGFLEIRDIFSDPIFYNKDRIVPNSVLLIVNCADPRGLYQRIKSTYDIPALDGLGFAKRAFFVLNPTLAAARIESAKTQFTSGAKTNTAVGSATATKDQMQWFDQYKLRPGYKDAQVALLRVAKLQEKERAGIIIEIEELVVQRL